MNFLWCFLIGGAICFIGQILILKTNWTPARILVSFVVIGAFLQAIDVFEPIKTFAGSGITVPITGFGGTMTKGVFDAIDKDGFVGIFTGGLTSVAAGVAVAIVSGFIMALFFRSRSK
ncbi:MAG: SpoVA/SpoVAEb family sporulation membrane protein [Christensenellaceae bacterium]|jgi:stage V sporulation protein AE|nr:SpoVA/SpoVAEb family sporulation membrane protein [Christensenellaceae bacterium]